jgi:glutamate mutase epsilon subunit
VKNILQQGVKSLQVGVKNGGNHVKKILSLQSATVVGEDYTALRSD